MKYIYGFIKLFRREIRHECSDFVLWHVGTFTTIAANMNVSNVLKIGTGRHSSLYSKDRTNNLWHIFPSAKFCCIDAFWRCFENGNSAFAKNSFIFFYTINAWYYAVMSQRNLHFVSIVKVFTLLLKYIFRKIKLSILISAKNKLL